jgi:hypothetical protein
MTTKKQLIEMLADVSEDTEICINSSEDGDVGVDIRTIGFPKGQDFYILLVPEDIEEE